MIRSRLMLGLLSMILTGCATCNVTPALSPACPQDLPCVRTDKGAILYLECYDNVKVH